MNYFLLALRNLHRKGIRSWLTLLGICIGIAAVISLIGLGNGLNAAVSSQFGVSSTEVISIQASGGNFGPPGYDVITPLTTDDLNAVRGLSGVEFAIPRNIETISIDFNDKILFTSATSIPEDYEDETYEISNFEAEQGRLIKSGDSRKIFIGANIAEESQTNFGKQLTVGKTVTILGEEFTVIGILKKQGSFVVDGIVFMYDNDLESLANYGDEVDIITVKARSKDLVEKLQEDIEKLMRQRRDVDKGSEDFTVSTPAASLAQINQILGGIQAFIIIIASISIIIGAVGIINTMTTSVLERKKEIGIMKAVGAKNSQIFAQFFIESGFLGLIGGGIGVIFGIILGYFGTFAINNFLGSEAAPQINFLLIIFSLFGSFLIGALAGIFPAMRAAKQNPVQALNG
ncbi:ABC transporter permease [Candidatus Pacearchaeota archaeon]|nr:ABC transporter permease [Candidatus Pacearchaeota archaeon]